MGKQQVVGVVKEAVALIERARDALEELVRARGGPSEGDTDDATLEQCEVALDEVVGALDTMYRVDDRLGRLDTN